MWASIRVKQLVAGIVCFGFYWGAKLPTVSDQQRQELASEFQFEAIALPERPGPHRTQRSVNSKLSHIAGWISSIGASVCLGDLDSNGRADDLCLVDPRTDEVFVMPVPGTAHRYDVFTLTFDRLAHDSPNVRPHCPKRMAPTGVRLADLNEDGRMDIVTCFWGRPPLAFLAREETPGAVINRSRFRAVEIAPQGDGWYSACLTVADLDGDGHHDLVVGNYDPENSPKLGEGGDISSVMQDSMSRAFNGGRDRFLLWQPPSSGDPNGIRFADVDAGLEAYLLTGWTLAVGAADLDGDLLPEVYFANDFGPDRLLHNRSGPGRLKFALLEGTKHFTTPNSKVLGRDSFKGMGIDFADINGDRLQDFFVSNIAGSWSLEESHLAFLSTGDLGAMAQGRAPYEDRSEELGLSRSGWGWDVKFGDFNNDGDLEVVQALGFLRGKRKRWAELHELAMGNDQLLCNPANWPTFCDGDDLSGDQHNAFFVHNGDGVHCGDGRYYNVAPFVGLATPYLTRGIATADCDGDGDLDFAIANQWGRSWYFENRKNVRAGLVLDLALTANDRLLDRIEIEYEFNASRRRTPAFGAAVVVHARSGDKTAFVDGGNGHSGARSHQLHFGLGEDIKRGESMEVEVAWRDRTGRRRHETVSVQWKDKIVYATLPRG